MMDGWISTLDALPEKNKVVLALKNDGTDLLYLSFAKLIDTTPERWSEVDYYVLGDALEIKPDNELVLYWREADLDGLSDIIGLWSKEKRLKPEPSNGRINITILNKDTGTVREIGTDKGDMLLVNSKGKLQYINLDRRETTGKLGNCDFIESRIDLGEWGES